MKTLVIIPTYNEAENLEHLVQDVLSSTDELHVLIIDDNSPDGTGIVADKLVKKNPVIKVIHRERKMGLGSAYLMGFRYALAQGYGHIIQMDCDFSHDPKDIPRFMEEMKKDGLDLVIGSRYADGGKIVGWPFMRHLLSRGGNFYARCLLGFSIKDWTTGYKLYKSAVFREVLAATSYADGYAFQAEVTYRAIKTGFKVKEIPIVFRERALGESKMGQDIIMEAARRVWKLRRDG